MQQQRGSCTPPRTAKSQCRVAGFECRVCSSKGALVRLQELRRANIELQGLSVDYAAAKMPNLHKTHLFSLCCSTARTSSPPQRPVPASKSSTTLKRPTHALTRISPGCSVLIAHLRVCDHTNFPHVVPEVRRQQPVGPQPVHQRRKCLHGKPALICGAVLTERSHRHTTNNELQKACRHSPDSQILCGKWSEKGQEKAGSPSKQKGPACTHGARLE